MPSAVRLACQGSLPSRERVLPPICCVLGSDGFPGQSPVCVSPQSPHNTKTSQGRDPTRMRCFALFCTQQLSHACLVGVLCAASLLDCCVFSALQQEAQAYPGVRGCYIARQATMMPPVPPWAVGNTPEPVSLDIDGFVNVSAYV